MTTKTLLLLRHAKSSWKNPDLPDQDRPLNGRGRKAAARMGRLIAEQKFSIDLVLSSSAVRTRQTASIVYSALQQPPPISFRDELYHASPEQIAKVIGEVTQPATCILLIGHNPGLESFLEGLIGEAMHYPTAALAKIELPLESWNSFTEQTRGQLVHFWRPKELDSD